MSTKIYFAWRCKTRVFSPTFLPAYRKFQLDETAKYVRRIFRAAKQKVNEKSLKTFLAEAQRASELKTVDPCDIDSKLNVWFHKSYAYAIPVGGQRNDDFKTPRGVEEYPYWNNTDRPDDVSAQAWRARERTWDAVCLGGNQGDWNDTRLVHTVVDAKTDEGLAELVLRLLPKHKAPWRLY